MIELVGALTFATTDYVSRRLAGDQPNMQFLTLDFRRVPNITKGAARLLGEVISSLANRGVTTILAGFEATSPLSDAIRAWTADEPKLRRFSMLDDAIEWAEDQVIYRYGGFARLTKITLVSEQALLAGFAAEEIAELAELCASRAYQAGQRIIGAGEFGHFRVLPTMRNGQRETAQRRASRLARPGNGVRRDGADRARA